METDLSDSQTVDDLVTKKVDINVEGLMKNSTEDQRKLAEKRSYITIYNRKKEELYLNDLNDRIDAVKNKIFGIPNRKKLKNFLGKLEPFLMFSADGAALNKKGTGILKKLKGSSLIVTHTDLPDNKIVMAYEE